MINEDMKMEIKTTQDIAGEFIKVRDGLEDRHLENPETMKLILDKKWIAIDSLHKRLSTVMNVRNNEKDMRLLFIEIQREYHKYR